EHIVLQVRAAKRIASPGDSARGVSGSDCLWRNPGRAGVRVPGHWPIAHAQHPPLRLQPAGRHRLHHHRRSQSGDAHPRSAVSPAGPAHPYRTRIEAALVSVERLHLALPEERGDTMTATVRHLTILELEAGLDEI